MKHMSANSNARNKNLRIAVEVIWIRNAIRKAILAGEKNCSLQPLRAAILTYKSYNSTTTHMRQCTERRCAESGKIVNTHSNASRMYKNTQ